CPRESRSYNWCCTISQPQGNRSRTSHFLKRGSVGSGSGSRTISRNSRVSRRSQWLAPSQNPFRLTSRTTRKIKAPPVTKAISTSEPVGKVGKCEKPPRTLFRLNRIQTHDQELRPELRQTACAGRAQFKLIHMTCNTRCQRRPRLHVQQN